MQIVVQTLISRVLAHKPLTLVSGGWQGVFFFMEFTIPVAYEVWGRVTVDAEDERDLAKKLSSKDFIDDMPLPDEPEYVEDSYQIDTDDINGSASVTDDGKQGPDINLTDEELKAIDQPTWDQPEDTS